MLFLLNTFLPRALRSRSPLDIINDRNLNLVACRHDSGPFMENTRAAPFIEYHCKQTYSHQDTIH